MAGLLNRPLAFVYFYLLLGLMAVYTFINIYFSHDKKGAGKIFKLIFFLSATIFGGLIFLL